MTANLRCVALMVGCGLVAASPLHAAAVLFHDGLSHTIPGDPGFANGDRIDLDLASILVVNPSAQVIGPPLSLNDTGGTIGGLLAHPGTTLQIDGGEIRGGPVTGFSDENTPSTGFGVYAGEGVDSLGNLMITAGSIEGGAVGKVTLLGGTFRGDTSLEIPFSSEVASDARIDILGGDLDSLNAIDLRLAHPDLTTTIYGNDLELDGNPVANPIVATSGTISGVFVNGQTFSWTFERLNGAPLVVPEPALGLVPGLVALAALARFRKLDRA